MTDPLAEVVALLQPNTSFSKLMSASGPWRVRRGEVGRPFYGVILEGACRVVSHGQAPVVFESGDFVLIPSADDFATSSVDPVAPDDLETMPVEVRPGEYRIGPADGVPNIRMLVGYCDFGSPDAGLLVSLLPRLVHVRGVPRLTTLLQLVNDETRAQRPARQLVLTRLIEILFIEALRSGTGIGAPPGLMRGLAEERVATALRRMHGEPARGWTVPELARQAGLSRSVFFERFQQAVGVAPMEYLLSWRMALAKDLLRRQAASIAEVAVRVGYSSASTFSVAFSRHVGTPPARYASSALPSAKTAV